MELEAALGAEGAIAGVGRSMIVSPFINASGTTSSTSSSSTTMSSTMTGVVSMTLTPVEATTSLLLLSTSSNNSLRSVPNILLNHSLLASHLFVQYPSLPTTCNAPAWILTLTLPSPKELTYTPPAFLPHGG